MKKKNKLNKFESDTKEIIILFIIFLIIWRIPHLFLDLGIIESALLPVIAFFIAHYIAMVLIKRKRGKFKNLKKK